MKIGIIGGSGLEDPKILKNQTILEVETKYGRPSSAILKGKIGGVEVFIISRHGKKHTIMPTNVPYRANILALKNLGCTHIIATTACGSLREEIKPGDFVILDSFIDMTRKRAATFYDEDVVCHIPMAEPFCENLRKLLYDTAQILGYPAHPKGAVVTIEGPRFSTRAESLMFKQLGGDVINMSTVPEVVLAREAGLHYASIAMVTDYDCWRIGEKAVEISDVFNIFSKNVEKVQKLILKALPKIKDYRTCPCKTDIKKSIISKF